MTIGMMLYGVAVGIWAGAAASEEKLRDGVVLGVVAALACSLVGWIIRWVS